MHPIEIKLKNINSFLEKIFKLLKQDNINISLCELDHICYRVETLEKYEELKIFLRNFGTQLTEVTIGGRFISNFKLNTPIIFDKRKIYLVELPSPKQGTNYKEVFEHVEFVISDSFDTFMKKYNTIKFDTTDLSKSFNQSITINYENCSVKFHQNSLEYVIKYENPKFLK